MARRREPIRVEAYVTVSGKETNVDDLTAEQRGQLASWLRITYLNELFRGQAEFFAVDGQSLSHSEALRDYPSVTA